MTKYLALALLALTLVLSGCSSQPKRSQPILEPVVVIQPVVEKPRFPIHRHNIQNDKSIKTDRYTSVSQEPLPEQIDLLSISISTTIPRQFLTVKDSIEFLLMRSGYKLLDLSEQSLPTQMMMSNELPESHRKIQTMTLRAALAMLAGASFELRENDVYRTVMYVKK